jgi:multidrug transporter EmrE-like cation transporter
MQIVLLVIIILIVIAEGSAMFTLKKSTEERKEVYILLGILLYALVAMLLRQSFMMDKIGIINGLWSAVSVISAIVVGRVFYGEELTTAELGAICMAGAAAGILSAS